MKVAEAVAIMIVRGFRYLPIEIENKVMELFSARDVLAREVEMAVFNDQANNALG